MRIDAIFANKFNYNKYQPKAVCLPKADLFIKPDTVSFRSATTAGNALKALRGLTCPYYGGKMIAGSDMSRIEKKLDKCSTLKDTIKTLSPYKEFMQKTERAIFERLKQQAKEQPNSTIDACLKQWYDDALTKLKLEEFNVLDSVDKISMELSPKTALDLRHKTTRCRQVILVNNQEDTFKRKTFLTSLDEITPLPGEVSTFEKMKDKALFLPTSGSSENAFIVKYANRSNQETAKRLLRASVATVEHVKPESLGGANSIDNFILASASANSYRSNMPLSKYIDRFPKIPVNCQKYMDKIIALMNRGALKGNELYPYKITRLLNTESEGRINLDLSNYKYTENQAKAAEKRYRSSKKSRPN